MFDTFLGLPLHVLVLHFTVVLLPLSAGATIGVFLHEPWRRRYAGRLAVVNAAMLVLTFVTVRAGLDLKDRYRDIGNEAVPLHDHQQLGETLLWIVLALAVASAAAWWLGQRNSVSGPVGLALGVVVAALAVASIVLTILTGHTGSKSHWGDFVKSTDNAAQQPS